MRACTPLWRTISSLASPRKVDSDGDGLVSEADVVSSLNRAGNNEAGRIASQMAAEIAALSMDPAEEFDSQRFFAFWIGITIWSGPAQDPSPGEMEEIIRGLEVLFLGMPGDMGYDPAAGG